MANDENSGVKKWLKAIEACMKAAKKKNVIRHNGENNENEEMKIILNGVNMALNKQYNRKKKA